MTYRYVSCLEIIFPEVFVYVCTLHITYYYTNPWFNVLLLFQVQYNYLAYISNRLKILQRQPVAI